MKHALDTIWKGDMKFEAELDGHRLVVDASPEQGGEDSGPRPKKLMLLALAGCTGMDVVALLKKMRQEVKDFSIQIEGNLTEEHPKHYDAMHIVYRIKGVQLDREKVQKAVEMSQERYCGVSAAYRKAMSITWELILEEYLEE